MLRSPTSQRCAQRACRLGSPLLVLAGIAAGIGLVVACAGLEWQPIGPRRTAPIEGAEPIGAEECDSCHEDVQGHDRIASYHAACESCHGAGSLHAESEAPSDIRHPANRDCLACHSVARNTHLQWGTGEHSRAGLLCTDCHNPHEPSRRHLRAGAAPAPGTFRGTFRNLDAISGLCLGCHEDIGAQLHYPSHHPVPEGAMSCLSCHDPHEDRRAAGGDRTQLCAGCHQDLMGPWIFEHPPVTDDCSICHDPHGAVGDDLLATIQPVICLSCHPVNDLMHHDPGATGIAGNTVGSRITPREAGTFLDRCTDCHGAVHGSYTDAHLRH